MTSQSATFLQTLRLAYSPRIPPLLQHLERIGCKPLATPPKAHPQIAELFPRTSAVPVYGLANRVETCKRPLKVGALFSGGPAAGGHNVLTGLFDALMQIDSTSELYGFLGGFSGLIENRAQELNKAQIDAVRNQGGFDLIGSGRTKIETAEHLQAAMGALKNRSLDALVVIGGDDSNTNAAVLAEYFLQQGSPLQVIGIPKTIDGDLRSEDIELSFGFDTACKTYAEIIGNIARDAISAKKYYHFIKLMGRSASHIVLECALATQPNLAFIGEEGKTLEQIVGQIADLVLRRQAIGKEYGVILIPEGLIEFMPEIKKLIEALNLLLAIGDLPRSSEEQIPFVEQRLAVEERRIFRSIPPSIQTQLLFDRDPHGNVKVSQIATEQLLMTLVKERLKEQGFKGSFTPQEHFLGYEGRSGYPTNFDADYAYSLGRMAALAVRDKLTGVICALCHLKEGVAHWEPRFAPIVPMMRIEQRKGKNKPVIDKTLVDLKGTCFQYFALHRKEWELEDRYCFPGPIQFCGDSQLTDLLPFALAL